MQCMLKEITNDGRVIHHHHHPVPLDMVDRFEGMGEELYALTLELRDGTVLSYIRTSYHDEEVV